MQVRTTTVFATLLALLLSCLARADDAAVRELRFEPKDEERSRTVPVKVYITDKQAAQPVVLFSHGLGGSRENNAFLGKHWAEAGYVGVFMQHHGSDEEVWKSVRGAKRLTAMKTAASAGNSRLRFADVPFVIDQLEAWNKEDGHPLRGKLDLDRIGMSGHSYGAVTTLAVAGRKFPFRRSYPDERIDAFLAMSPQPGKALDPKKGFGHLSKPILCMTGTSDTSVIDPKITVDTRRAVYKALPAGDKYQLVLEGAEHLAFGDSRLGARRRNPKHHPAIQQISLQFWDAYLKDNTESKQWLQSQRPITETGLGDSDVWEQK